MIDLLKVCVDCGLPRRQIVEVGVNQPQLAQARTFLQTDAPEKAVLIEPLSRHADSLRACYGADPRVTVIRAAVCDENGEVLLYDLDQSSFLTGLSSSPAVANGYFRRDTPVVSVPGITFDRADDGAIDVLAADIEGAEWFILKHMTSRPGLICLETHLSGHPYVNPYRPEITRWMRTNGYQKLGQDRTDSVWVRAARRARAPRPRRPVTETRARGRRAHRIRAGSEAP